MVVLENLRLSPTFKSSVLYFTGLLPPLVSGANFLIEYAINFDKANKYFLTYNRKLSTFLVLINKVTIKVYNSISFITFVLTKSKTPMKIKITETREIEKATPFFTRQDGTYYAFYSETERLTVYDFKDNPLISMTSDYQSASYPEITAKEFEDAYVRVSERLSDLFEQGRDIARDSKSIDTLINELNKD